MTPYIFCEPCAGSAAVSYGLLGCKPPISYMGSKSGYVIPIMEALGLSRLSPPAACVLGEPGPWAAVHAALGGATGCSAEDVAGYLAYCVRTRLGGGGFRRAGGTGSGGLCYNTESPAPTIDALPHPAAPIIAEIIRSWKDEEPRALWERLKAKGWPSLLLPEGSEGRWLGPQSVEEVAGFLAACLCSYKSDTKHGYNAGRMEHGEKPSGAHHYPVTIGGMGERAADIQPFPLLAVWQGTAETMPLPSDLSRWVMYMDGPYHGDGSRKITGYPHGTFSREQQIAFAASCHARGARFSISECVGLAAEMEAATGSRWWNVDISGERRGQKRTMSVQQHEWLTMNFPPHHWPGKQEGLWKESR